MVSFFNEVLFSYKMELSFYIYYSIEEFRNILKERSYMEKKIYIVILFV